jgi:RimJ/RimL family protein N-acetyltransferase
MVPILNIIGERVALGPLDRSLLPTYLRWANDFVALRNLDDAPRPRTIEGREHSAWFTIYACDGWEPVGVTALGEIDHRNRTATFFIFIGESTNRGKGYGTEATRLILDYAFTALGLHNVMLTVAGWNAAGQRAYQKAGFREFGRRHECALVVGQRWDTIYMEALASEFESPVLKAVLVPDAPRT